MSDEENSKWTDLNTIRVRDTLRDIRHTLRDIVRRQPDGRSYPLMCEDHARNFPLIHTPTVAAESLPDVRIRRRSFEPHGIERHTSQRRSSCHVTSPLRISLSDHAATLMSMPPTSSFPAVLACTPPR